MKVRYDHTFLMKGEMGIPVRRYPLPHISIYSVVMMNNIWTMKAIERPPALYFYVNKENWEISGKERGYGYV